MSNEVPSNDCFFYSIIRLMGGYYDSHRLIHVPLYRAVRQKPRHLKNYQ